jgi:RimJ/RimL family protein N-acetyltransferase
MRNPIKVGERVYLRPLETSDADLLAQHHAADTDTFMVRGRNPPSPIAAERWITDLHKQQPPADIEIAVCLKDGDRLIGSVGLESIDYVNRTAETGSWLSLAEARGQGYGTEAKHLLLEYAFDNLHLHILRSTVWEPNTRSAAALAKQGYRPAGRVKWFEIKDGIYRDMLYFDVTREEWLAARDAWRTSRG